MRAKFIYENAHFERGRDPKETMRVGRWAEKELKQIFDYIVGNHRGTYTIKWEGPIIAGSYVNDLFGSGGRSLVWNIENGRKFMTWPGDDMEIDMSPKEFMEEVHRDLTAREEVVKKLGYNPYRNGEFAISRP